MLFRKFRVNFISGTCKPNVWKALITLCNVNFLHVVKLKFDDYYQFIHEKTRW